MYIKFNVYVASGSSEPSADDGKYVYDKFSYGMPFH